MSSETINNVVSSEQYKTTEYVITPQQLTPKENNEHGDMAW